AGCLFPLTDNPEIAKSVGTRHRAGIGITEESDALVVIVSEETGNISLGVKGELTRNLDKESLENILEGLYLKEEKVIPKKETAAKADGTT
ncbi:MAG: DNA integrity scanning protein DisA nucleotide-binding domain protein, partial [Planctomycetes bacterium]|nr:DNA integrity scanning protein DisA nucleotide-binding domain protein [Planctomycetota bacterium]